MEGDNNQVLASLVSGMQELCSELSSAISAIASFDILTLETHLERQEVICQRLQKIALTPSLFVTPAGLRQPSSEGAAGLRLQEELRESQQTLADLNRTYAALLDHSVHTADLLSGLHRSFAERYGVSLSPADASRLSCEG